MEGRITEKAAAKAAAQEVELDSSLASYMSAQVKKAGAESGLARNDDEKEEENEEEVEPAFIIDYGSATKPEFGSRLHQGDDGGEAADLLGRTRLGDAMAEEGPADQGNTDTAQRCVPAAAAEEEEVEEDDDDDDVL